MKYIVLLLKVLLLFFLVAIRLGELDLVTWFAPSKYKGGCQYYTEMLSNIGIFLLLLDFLQVVLVSFYRRRKRLKADDNFIIGMGQIYTLLLYCGLFLGFLSLFRMEFKEVFTSISIIFAGIAILTKDYISNMINGMIMTFSGQLSIGDNVRINQHTGKVVDISLQSIQLLNDDDDYIFIPNNIVFTNELINYTKRAVKRTSIEFDIDLKHLKNVEELETNIINSLKPFHHLIKEESYYLRVAQVNKDFVQMKFQYILKQPDKELERQIRRRTIRHVVGIISEREKIVDKLDLENWVDL